MERVVITRAILGICHCQVCAVKDATDEEILNVANTKNRAGTRNGWEVVREEGTPRSPVVCTDDTNRTHFLLVC